MQTDYSGHRSFVQALYRNDFICECATRYQDTQVPGGIESAMTGLPVPGATAVKHRNDRPIVASDCLNVQGDVVEQVLMIGTGMLVERRVDENLRVPEDALRCLGVEGQRMQNRVHDRNVLRQHVMHVAHMHGVVSAPGAVGNYVPESQVGAVVAQDAAIGVGNADVPRPGVERAGEVDSVVAALQVVAEERRIGKLESEVFDSNVLQAIPSCDLCRNRVIRIVQQRVGQLHVAVIDR